MQIKNISRISFSAGGSAQLLNVFPNYKYDFSFGGRHRLCMLRVTNQANLYYIENKELQSCLVDITFANKILKSNIGIKNNIYFKYTEKLIDAVLNIIPYKYSIIYNETSNEKPQLYTHASFIDHPEILFSCNCQINIDYTSI